MKILKTLRFPLILTFVFISLLLIGCSEPKCKHENIEMEIVNPTHNDCGYTEYSCPDCDYSYIEAYVDPTPHAYQMTSIEPTCENGGRSIYKCSCGYSYTANIVPPLGHEYETVTTTPSCTASGSTKYICKRCEDSYISDITSSLGHSYSDTPVEPTCTSQGYTIHNCDCGYSYKDSYTAPQDHVFKESITLPTCVKQGFTTFVCDCGYNFTDNYTAILPHSFTETVISPTCTDEGFTTYVCDCGYKFDGNVVKPTGHTLVETIIPPTCTEQGLSTFTCKCGFSFNDNFTAPLEHKFSQTLTEPTCTKEGFTTYACDCGYTFVSTYVEPKGHSLTSAITAPTCTDQGFTTYTCECGYSFVDNYTSPTEHTLSQLIIPPACTNQGYTIFSCECGYTFNDKFTEPLPHDFKSEVLFEASCTQQGKIKYTCYCGETYTETTKSTEHNFIKQVTMPTLSDMGYTIFTCESCEYTYTGDIRFYSDIVSGAHVNEPTLLAKGIDISYHNYQTDSNGNYLSLDWENIKNAGITYVIIRIGDASIGIDPTFEKSYAEAKAAGLDIGFYFYTRAQNAGEITLEANLVLSALQGKQFEYPVYLDLEDESQKDLGASVLNEMCITFFTTLQRAGYYTGLYVNDDWLYNAIDTSTALSRFDIWYARHTEIGLNKETIWSESYGKPFGMWQYTDSGTIEGINHTPFDLNYCYKDYPSIIKEGGFNGYEANVEFPDTGKSFVWVTYQGTIKVRSKNDFFIHDEYDSSLDVIGYVSYGSRFKVVEQNELYTAIEYNGNIAYITAKSEYVSFEGLYIP